MALDFVRYCRANRGLIIFTALCVLVSFSALLLRFTISLDTEVQIANGDAFRTLALQLNRCGLVLLTGIWQAGPFNPFYATAAAMFFLALSVVSWAFFISYFDEKSSARLPLFAFAGIAATSPITVESIQFAGLAPELFFCVFLTPFVIIMLFEGCAEKSRGKIAAAALLMAFILCVYQSFAVLFIFAFAAAFLFMSRKSDFDKALPLKIFAAFLASLAVYWAAGKLTFIVLGLEKSDYLSNMTSWADGSVKNILVNIFGQMYALTLAKIEPLHSAISSAFLDNSQVTSWGMPLSDRIRELSVAFGSVTLIPIAIIFLAYVFLRRGKGGNFIYFSAGVLVPLSILLLPLFLGNKVPLRTLFLIPFVFGFLFYFVISRSAKTTGRVFAAIAFIVAISASQMSSSLLYSNAETFRHDIFLAQQIDYEIRKLENTAGSNIVALIGSRVPPTSPNYVRGDIIGFSKFEYGTNNFYESTTRGTALMKSLGINCRMPDSSQMEAARIISREMPSFPQNGSVRVCDDFITVKLSESDFVPHKHQRHD